MRKYVITKEEKFWKRRVQFPFIYSEKLSEKKVGIFWQMRAQFPFGDSVSKAGKKNI